MEQVFNQRSLLVGGRICIPDSGIGGHNFGIITSTTPAGIYVRYNQEKGYSSAYFSFLHLNEKYAKDWLDSVPEDAIPF